MYTLFSNDLIVLDCDALEDAYNNIKSGSPSGKVNKMVSAIVKSIADNEGYECYGTFVGILRNVLLLNFDIIDGVEIDSFEVIFSNSHIAIHFAIEV